MSEYYSITFRYMSRYNKLELVRALLTRDWTLEYNGLMFYVDFPATIEDRNPDHEDHIMEDYDLERFLAVAQTRYDHGESISFSARTEGIQQLLFFIFDSDGSLDVSFSWLDAPFSEEYKLADLNLVLFHLFKFFTSNHCEIHGYKIEWGDPLD